MHGKISVPQWREVRHNGKPQPSLYNTRAGLMAMRVICRHDLFRDITLIGFAGDELIELTNATLLMLRQGFSEQFGYDADDKYIFDAVKTLAFENRFDPILDMLADAQRDWDQVPRLDTWVMTYLRSPDTPLNRAIGRKVLLAAVRRARVPGCKYDNIAVLEGLEGIFKSTAIRTLAGDEYFSDQSILGARDQEIQEQLTGVWMHESADLTGMKKAEVEHVKAFASRQVDRARPAYGRAVERRPRRSIDWATTNDEVYMQSQTGNRRFWPLPCGIIDIEALRRDRLQLLGEAAHYEAAGESLVLDEKLWPKAKDEQESRRVHHPWEDILANIPDVVHSYLDFTTGQDKTKQIVYRSSDDTREIVASADILTHVLRIPEGQQRRDHSMQLATVMKLLGWERPAGQKVTIEGNRVRGYHRWIGEAASG
jgi:predicted P-loop ATPase